MKTTCDNIIYEREDETLQAKKGKVNRDKVEVECIDKDLGKTGQYISEDRYTDTHKWIDTGRPIYMDQGSMQI